jgi:putative peptidoglycan lipid II flippase
VSVASAVELALLAWGMRRAGVLPAPRIRGAHPALRDVYRGCLPLAGGALLMTTTVVVDQAMASTLGAGSVSVLNYAYKLVAFSQGIGAVALGTAVYPHFSRMVAWGDWAGVRHVLASYLRLVFFATLPCAVAAAVLAPVLTRVLFVRGAFTPEDARVVSPVMAIFVFQVPIFLAGTLLVRLVSALRASRVLMWGALCNTLVNVGLNWAFMRWWGVAGLALSTVCVYAFSFCYLYFSVRRLLRHRIEASAAAPAVGTPPPAAARAAT